MQRVLLAGTLGLALVLAGVEGAQAQQLKPAPSKATPGTARIPTLAPCPTTSTTLTENVWCGYGAADSAAFKAGTHITLVSHLVTRGTVLDGQTLSLGPGRSGVFYDSVAFHEHRVQLGLLSGDQVLQILPNQSCSWKGFTVMRFSGGFVVMGVLTQPCTIKPPYGQNPQTLPAGPVTCDGTSNRFYCVPGQ